MDYDPLEVIVEHEYIYTPLSVDYEAYDGLPLNVDDAVMLAQMAYGEYRNADNYEQATATMWCVLNRVDSPLYPDSVEKVIKQPGQFHGYSVKNPVDAKLYDLAVEVLKLWESEKLEGHRTLPKEYLYFSGDGTINKYRTQDGKIYDWNMEEIK